MRKAESASGASTIRSSWLWVANASPARATRPRTAHTRSRPWPGPGVFRPVVMCIPRARLEWSLLGLRFSAGRTRVWQSPAPGLAKRSQRPLKRGIDFDVAGLQYQPAADFACASEKVSLPGVPRRRTRRLTFASQSSPNRARSRLDTMTLSSPESVARAAKSPAGPVLRFRQFGETGQGPFEDLLQDLLLRRQRDAPDLHAGSGKLSPAGSSAAAVAAASMRSAAAWARSRPCASTRSCSARAFRRISEASASASSRILRRMSSRAIGSSHPTLAFARSRRIVPAGSVRRRFQPWPEGSGPCPIPQASSPRSALLTRSTAPDRHLK